MKLLITGSDSGLGRYLHQTMGGVSLTRGDSLNDIRQRGPYSHIIHCAFNRGNELGKKGLYNYVNDNLFLTRELLEIPHGTFVYLSSIDVYPCDGNTYSESDIINNYEDIGLYGVTKLFCESLVQEMSPDFLILRSGMLLGKYMKDNNLTRILRRSTDPLSLRADSTLNCLLYKDMGNFIEKAFEWELRGIFNAVRSDIVELAEIADKYHPDSQFGTHCYTTAKASNEKICLYSRDFAQSSHKAIDHFFQELS